MAACSFMLSFERRIGGPGDGRRPRSGILSVPPENIARRRPRSATTCALLTALASTVLILGTVVQVCAQTQSWNIVVAPTITIVGVGSSTFPGATLHVSVTPPSGTFTVPSVTFGPVSAGGCAISVTATGGSGSFDTALNLTVVATVSSTPSTGCPSGPLTITSLPGGGARLDKTYPSATTTVSAGTLSGTGLGFTGSGNFTASCQSGCVAPPSPLSPIVQATSASKQAAALGTVALTTTTVQTTNIGLRLNALRGGATGASTSGLALNVEGHSVPLTALTSLVPSLGGGASADRSSVMSRLGVFANGQGSFGDQNATSREPGFDFHTAGLTVGADYRVLDPLILGLAFGYLRTKTDLDASAGESRINGYSVSLYGNYYIVPKLYLDGIATFGWNSYHVERNIPDADARATANTDGNQFSFSASTGYDFKAGPLTVGPTGRVTYTRVHIDGYREHGADPLNARVDGQTIESLTTDLGGQASYAISTPWGVLAPLVRFEWEHEFKGDSRSITATALADPTARVSTLTSNPDRDYFNLGAGLSATLKAGVSAFVYFEETLGRAHFTNHSFTGGVRVDF